MQEANTQYHLQQPPSHQQFQSNPINLQNLEESINFKRYCYYEGSFKQPDLHHIPEIQLEHSHHQSQNSNEEVRDQYATSHNFEQAQFYGTNYNSFIRSRNTEIFILDQFNNKRSLTADGDQKRKLPLQNIHIQMQEKQRNLERNQIERIPQRNIHSRENIQQVNRKYQRIRANRYPSKIFATDHQLITPKTQFRLKGFAKGISLPASPSKIHKKSGEKLLRSQSLKNKGGMISSSPFAGSQLNKNQFSPGNRVKKMKQNRASSLSQISQIKPHNFKSTIKIKSIDDNPNILANIIRKKADFLGRQQLFDYLQKIMRKGSAKKG